VIEEEPTGLLIEEALKRHPIQRQAPATEQLRTGQVDVADHPVLVERHVGQRRVVVQVRIDVARMLELPLGLDELVALLGQLLLVGAQLEYDALQVGMLGRRFPQSLDLLEQLSARHARRRPRFPSHREILSAARRIPPSCHASFWRERSRSKRVSTAPSMRFSRFL
jgi:hypothetical protein